MCRARVPNGPAPGAAPLASGGRPPGPGDQPSPPSGPRHTGKHAFVCGAARAKHIDQGEGGRKLPRGEPTFYNFLIIFYCVRSSTKNTLSRHSFVRGLAPSGALLAGSNRNKKEA